MSDKTQVERMLEIQAQYERDEARDDMAVRRAGRTTPTPGGPPAIEMSMDDDRITFRDQEALDEYVTGALGDRAECPQGIHGWRQATPNGLCPWCEWERVEANP